MDEAAIRERCKALDEQWLSGDDRGPATNPLEFVYRAAYADGQRDGMPAIQLVRLGEYVCVFVRVDGKWVEVIREFHDVFFNHTVEPAGIEAAIRQAAGEVGRG